MREDRLDLRGEHNPVRVTLINQRLLPCPVAGQYEPARAIVPEADGEHAVEPFDEFGAVILVQVDDRFGVAVGTGPVAARLEVGAEGLEVVDLAVENGPD